MIIPSHCCVVSGAPALGVGAWPSLGSGSRDPLNPTPLLPTCLPRHQNLLPPQTPGRTLATWDDPTQQAHIPAEEATGLPHDLPAAQGGLRGSVPKPGPSSAGAFLPPRHQSGAVSSARDLRCEDKGLRAIEQKQPVCAAGEGTLPALALSMCFLSVRCQAAQRKGACSLPHGRPRSMRAL